MTNIIYRGYDIDEHNGEYWVSKVSKDGKTKTTHAIKDTQQQAKAWVNEQERLKYAQQGERR